MLFRPVVDGAQRPADARVEQRRQQPRVHLSGSYLLGPDYVVWDKVSTIRFKQPGRTALYARVALDEPELESIRAALIDRPKLDRIFEIHPTDSAGNVHASIEKTIHIRRKAL